MRSFLHFINEELTDKQKATVNSYGTGEAAEKISQHVIPKGQHKVVIPLEDKQDIKITTAPPMLQKHLDKHGYDVEDYIKGIVRNRSNGMTIKLGKVLAKTDPSGDFLHEFNHDPNRSATRSHSGFQVVISRHPHDVAGMSTDRGWTSCMDMYNGINTHYLKHDIQHGTHVAYLTHAGDDDIKNPIARIALKPWQTAGKDPHTILLPENKTYGTSNEAFNYTVKNWAEENFPPRIGEEYEKNPKVYNDDGSRRRVISKDFKHIERLNQMAERGEVEPHHLHPFMGEKSMPLLAKHSSLAIKKMAINETHIPEIILKHTEPHEVDSVLDSMTTPLSKRMSAEFSSTDRLRKVLNLDDVKDVAIANHLLNNKNGIPQEWHEALANHDNYDVGIKAMKYNSVEGIHEKIKAIGEQVKDHQFNFHQHDTLMQIAKQGLKSHLTHILDTPSLGNASIYDQIAERGFSEHIGRMIRDEVASPKHIDGSVNNTLAQKGRPEHLIHMIKSNTNMYGEGYATIIQKSRHYPQVAETLLKHHEDFLPSIKQTEFIRSLHPDLYNNYVKQKLNEGDAAKVTQLIYRRGTSDSYDHLLDEIEKHGNKSSLLETMMSGNPEDHHVLRVGHMYENELVDPKHDYDHLHSLEYSFKVSQANKPHIFKELSPILKRLTFDSSLYMSTFDNHIKLAHLKNHVTMGPEGIKRGYENFARPGYSTDPYEGASKILFKHRKILADSIKNPNINLIANDIPKKAKWFKETNDEALKQKIAQSFEVFPSNKQISDVIKHGNADLLNRFKDRPSSLRIFKHDAVKNHVDPEVRALYQGP